MISCPLVGLSTRLLGSLFFAMVIALWSGVNAKADPITWMEDFALAVDREAKLAELIPGTDEYYFYHCLHYQTSGQLERSEAVLRDWLAENKGRETPSIAIMTDRQRLLTYQQSPQRSIHSVPRMGDRASHVRCRAHTPAKPLVLDTSTRPVHSSAPIGRVGIMLDACPMQHGTP